MFIVPAHFIALALFTLCTSSLLNKVLFSSLPESLVESVFEPISHLGPMSLDKFTAKVWEATSQPSWKQFFSDRLGRFATSCTITNTLQSVWVMLFLRCHECFFLHSYLPTESLQIGVFKAQSSTKHMSNTDGLTSEPEQRREYADQVYHLLWALPPSGNGQSSITPQGLPKYCQYRSMFSWAQLCNVSLSSKLVILSLLSWSYTCLLLF